MGIPKEEQETVITWMRDEEYATVFTSDRTIMTKMNNRCRDNPNQYKHVNDDYCNGELSGSTYTMPKKMITFRTGVSKNNPQNQN